MDKVKRVAEDALIRSSLSGVRMTIQNVDITKFPLVKLIVEVLDDSARAMESLDPSTLTVVENGVTKTVIGVEKITISERIPVDFMFIVDITGTMQSHINGVKDNIDVTRAKWMPSANRVAVIITDAPYHQFGEKGNGRTYMTTETIIPLLRDNKVRLFSIVPPQLHEYKLISESTRGAVFDIEQPFSRILDQYSMQLTNLYAVMYRSDSKMLRDSISVSILDENKRELVKQIIPIVEIGRKFIIENLLFPIGSATLPPKVEELDILMEFMKSRPAVQVRIEGHTDNTGSVRTNKVLSLKRAETVKAYIVQHGIDQRRLQTLGHGPARPIADNTTEFGRWLNRRTEIIIIAK